MLQLYCYIYDTILEQKYTYGRYNNFYCLTLYSIVTSFYSLEKL